MKTDIRFTHQALVEKCKTGHSSSQYELYALYVDAMYNIGMRMLGSKEDAEDIVQDSFVSAFKNLSSFNYESTFGAWLKRIVINKSINYLKAKRIAVVPMDVHEFHLTEDIPEEVEAVDIKKVKIGILIARIILSKVASIYSSFKGFSILIPTLIMLCKGFSRIICFNVKT